MTRLTQEEYNRIIWKDVEVIKEVQNRDVWVKKVPKKITKDMINIPNEDYEIKSFSNYLQSNQYIYFNIMNESSIRLPIKVAAKRKRQWLKKWVSDFLIFLKNKKCILFVEMKRRKRELKNGKEWKSPSIVSKEQIEFINQVNKTYNMWAIVYGSKEAISILNKYDIK